MNRLLHQLGAIALGLLLFGPAAARAQDEPARGRGKGWAFDAGLDFFRRQDWDNAIRMLEEAFDDSPGDQEIQLWLLEAKAERAKARSAGGNASIVSLLCVPEPNPEGRKLPIGASEATPVQDPVKVRIDTAQKVVELRNSRDNYLLDRSGGVIISDTSYTWVGRDLPGGVRLSGTMNRETGRLAAAWLHEKAAADIPPSLEAFVGACRQDTP